MRLQRYEHLENQSGTRDLREDEGELGGAAGAWGGGGGAGTMKRFGIISREQTGHHEVSRWISIMWGMVME